MSELIKTLEKILSFEIKDNIICVEVIEKFKEQYPNRIMGENFLRLLEKEEDQTKRKIFANVAEEYFSLLLKAS